MATITKKAKKKRISLEGVVTLLFLIGLISYVTSSSMLRSENIALSEKAATLETTTSTLKQEISDLEVQVERLDNRDTMKQIAEENGLKVNAGQIVSVNENEENK